MPHTISGRDKAKNVLNLSHGPPSLDTLSENGNRQQKDDVISTDMTLEMLDRMASYFHSMVDPQTNRFYYRCLPESGRRVHKHCPIRDMGAAWDTATLMTFLLTLNNTKKWEDIFPRLSAAILATIEAFSSSGWHNFRDSSQHQCSALPIKVLQEPSNIAHSAFMIMAVCGAIRLSILDPSTCPVPLNHLVNGVLSMQEKSGAFAIHFGSRDIYRGIDFYPGEASLALLDVLQLSQERATRNEQTQLLSHRLEMRILASLKQASVFYTDYYRSGNVDDNYTSFFGNWQVQSSMKLYDVVEQETKGTVVDTSTKTESNPVTSDIVATYIFELCDAIVSSQPWKQLMKGHYKSISTVELACGLEALAEGTRLALQISLSTSSSIDRQRVSRYWPCIIEAVRFLSAVQNQVPDGSPGSGGLGHGILISEQRLDVTGHAVNALVKVYDIQKNMLAQQRLSFSSTHLSMDMREASGLDS